MECTSPEISNLLSDQINEENGMRLDYGFIMDHVKAVRDLSRSGFPDFLVYPDPEYFQFEDDDRVSD